MDYDYLARERALQMAQRDWRDGLIKGNALIAQARKYERYLRGEARTESPGAEVSPSPGLRLVHPAPHLATPRCQPGDKR